MSGDGSDDGVVGRTVAESVPDWPSWNRVSEDAPNVLQIVLDDVGYAQLGCFGSSIDTPNLDRLAEGGIQYTNFHTTAICAASRSSILNGRNHHSNGMGFISEYATGYPGYNARIPNENGFISEILSEQGYSTFALGKWHLTPEQETNVAAPRDRWPLGCGFDQYYGFLGAETNQYEPDLVRDNHRVDPPSTPQEGYHFTEDITNQAIEYLTDNRNIAPDRPFYMYYCPGATHAPHHVPAEWADDYDGEFDHGWDEARRRIFESQKEMGVVPPETELPPRNPDVPEWDDLSGTEQDLYARMMEIYAGFLEHTDHQIGRLLEKLEQLGELENTIVIVVSDNGASPEGTEVGTVNENRHFNMVEHDFDDNLAAMDDLGGPETYNHYPWGWAWAGNTPFRRWKRESYQGGMTDPMIVHWPDGIDERDDPCDRYTHAIDIVPTILDAVDVDPSEEINGVVQSPIEGTSFESTFEDDPDEPTPRTQYYEMLGTRAIYHDGWKAVCPWPGESFAAAEAEDGRHYGDEITPADLADIEATGWQLFHVAVDFAESEDLSEEHPEKLEELKTRWWTEAGKYDVLPIDGRTKERLTLEKLQFIEDRDRHVYYPGGNPIPESVAVDVKNRSHTLAATVDVPDDGVNGTILEHGGRFGGYSFFVRDGYLQYVSRFVDTDVYVVTADESIAAGSHVLAMELKVTQEFDFEAKEPAAGVVRLFVDDEQVGSGEVKKMTPLAYSIAGNGLTCGYSTGPSVSDEYAPPHEFTGDLHQITVDVTGDRYTSLDLQSQFYMRRE